MKIDFAIADFRGKKFMFDSHVHVAFDKNWQLSILFDIPDSSFLSDIGDEGYNFC